MKHFPIPPERGLTPHELGCWQAECQRLGLAEPDPAFPAEREPYISGLDRQGSPLVTFADTPCRGQRRFARAVLGLLLALGGALAGVVAFGVLVLVAVLAGACCWWPRGGGPRR